MDENVTNELLLETLKAVRADQSAVRSDIRELRDRQTETHAAVLAMRRDQIQDAENSAHLAARIDQIDRLERRLEISD